MLKTYRLMHPNITLTLGVGSTPPIERLDYSTISRAITWKSIPWWKWTVLQFQISSLGVNWYFYRKEKVVGLFSLLPNFSLAMENYGLNIYRYLIRCLKEFSLLKVKFYAERLPYCIFPKSLLKQRDIQSRVSWLMSLVGLRNMQWVGKVINTFNFRASVVRKFNFTPLVDSYLVKWGLCNLFGCSRNWKCGSRIWGLGKISEWCCSKFNGVWCTVWLFSFRENWRRSMGYKWCHVLVWSYGIWKGRIFNSHDERIFNWACASKWTTNLSKYLVNELGKEKVDRFL